MENDTDKGTNWKLKAPLQGEMPNIFKNTKQLWIVHFEKDTIEGS